MKHLGIIHQSGAELLELINGLLDLSRIESGKMEAEFEDVDLEYITNEFYERFKIAAKQKGIQFETTLAPGVPETLLTDISWLRQMVNNLLANAIKFTETGKVSLQVYTAASKSLPRSMHANGEVIAFSVKDTGIGIPKDRLSAVFEAFVQVDGSSRRNYGGSGLGLAIVQKMAKLLNGAIVVESEENKGSQFTIYLPMSGAIAQDLIPRGQVAQKANEQADQLIEEKHHDALMSRAQANTSAPAKQSPAESLSTILVVDDVEANRISAIASLEDFNCTILEAEDGKQAIELIQKHAIDLVLMDMMMPVMDGFEAMEFIRKDLRLIDLPIIAVTARAMEQDLDKCVESGANQCVIKPYEDVDLINAINDVMNLEGTAP